MSTDNIIDLATRRARRAEQRLIPPRANPILTLHLFEGEGSPLRLIGVPREAGELRIAAERLLNAAMALRREAYALDGDANALPRMLTTLFASGKLHVASYNAPNGDETAESLAWIRGCVPHFEKLLADLTQEALREISRHPPQK